MNRTPAKRLTLVLAAALVLTAAAGNSNCDCVSYPAGDQNVLGVGGVLPEVAGVVGRDAVAGSNLGGDGVRCWVGEGGHVFIVFGQSAAGAQPSRPSA